MHRLRPHSRAFTLLLGALTTLASFATDMGLPVLAEMAGIARRSAGPRGAVAERVHGRLRAGSARVRSRLRSRRPAARAAHRRRDVHRVRRVRRVHALASGAAALALPHGDGRGRLLGARRRDGARPVHRRRGARQAVVREPRGRHRADHRAHARRRRRDDGRMARDLWIPRGRGSGAPRVATLRLGESLPQRRPRARSRCSARSVAMRASSGTA